MEALDGIDHQLLNSFTLLPGDTGRQTESIDGATNTDPARMNRDILSNIALNLVHIHVGGVPGRGANSVVLLDQGVEHRGEVLVGVPVTSIDTAVLVVEINSAGDGLDEGESRGLGLDSLELLPLLLGDILGSKGVLGLNGGERSVGLSRLGLPLAGITAGEALVLLPQSVDTINHLLDQLNLRVSEPVLVGDVIGVSGLATGLSTGSTGLQVQLLAASLQPVNTGLVSPSG